MYRQYRVDREMLQVARRQFCLDTCLDWQEYLEHPDKKCYIQRTKYKAGTRYPEGEGARKYNGMDSFFKAIMCMGQLFLAVDEEIYDWAVERFENCSPEWFCEYNNLRMIDRKLEEYGRKINDTHVYFLPAEERIAGGNGEEDKNAHVALNGKEEKRILPVTDVFQWYNQEEILQFRENNRFTSAICFSPTQPDVLAVAALLEDVERMQEARIICEGMQENIVQERSEGTESEIEKAEKAHCSKEFSQSRMAGMAGVSADGEYLWQIGINVAPEYTGCGLAVKLVRQLKEEIIRQGKVPFYGTSESHTISQTIALKSGFMPAWTEIYVKSIEK